MPCKPRRIVLILVHVELAFVFFLQGVLNMFLTRKMTTSTCKRLYFISTRPDAVIFANFETYFAGIQVIRAAFRNLLG